MNKLRQEFEMTEDDLKGLLAASRPTPVMFVSGETPMGPSQQENANRAWAELGERVGFEAMSVEPLREKGDRFFTAIPKVSR